ncbi:major facilitator superfamily transporter [Ophiostoma piceae UAMH 11346]|uniref:Major facilitator superfamily transporter n=1 Tax=Ophiostoma piceae (strain UAMH 11346) TaxID=1262450 RepID=S3CET4_OPHP1|nr:major facilitator superfamily transporter [Ophiostoma piceae UAMH 11346]
MPSQAIETSPLLLASPDRQDGSSNGHSNGNGSSPELYRVSSTPSATLSASTNSQAISKGRGFAIAISMWVLIFMQASNMSGMTMAQSVVAADLDAYEHAMWFTSTYLIAAASFAPLAGRLASIFAASHLIAASSTFFTLGAVISAKATTLAVFLLGRVVLGVGGAGVMTLSLITVLQLTSKRRRGLFIGLVNAGFTVGLSLGAVVYGALLPLMSWRTLFLIQAPLSLFAGVGVLLSMPELPELDSDDEDEDDLDNLKKELTVWQKLSRIDYVGAALLTLTIVSFLYGLAGTIQLLPIFLSAVSLAAFIFTEFWYVPHVSGGDPIVPLEVLCSRGVLFSCLSQLGVMAARWTILYYAPIYVLAVRGFSAATSGSALIPTNLGFGTGGLIVGWLHVRRAGHFWLPSVVSVIFFSSTLFIVGLLSRAHADSLGTACYILALFLNGFCTGAYLNYTLAHVLHLTRPSTHFIITSLLATFRGFSGSFGTSIGGGFFMRRLAVQLADGFSRLDGGNLSSGRQVLITRLVGSPALVWGNDAQGHPVLTDAEREVAVLGYESALGHLYRWAAFTAMVVIFIQASTGWAAPKPRLSSTSSVLPGPSGLLGYEDGDETVDEDEIREAIVEHDATMEA